MNKTALTVVGAVILGLLGLWTAARSWSDLQHARALSDWILVNGVVVGSEIVGNRAPHPEILYRYSVDGIEKSGLTTLDVAGFGTKAARRDEAAKLVAQYSPGATVPVFYDPADPDQSTLRPFPIWSVYTRLGTGLFLLSGSLLIAGVMLRRKSWQSTVREEP